MDRSFLDEVNNAFELQGADVRQLPALALAYIGDCVFELVVRTTLVEQGTVHVSELSRKATALVRASAQAKLFRVIEGQLTEEEMDAFKRGRNVKSSQKAKNADIVDYRIATGLEALIGWLYMTGKQERAIGLIKAGLKEGRKDEI